MSRLHRTIPAHAGLGSGTQLALAGAGTRRALRSAGRCARPRGGHRAGEALGHRDVGVRRGRLPSRGRTRPASRRACAAAAAQAHARGMALRAGDPGRRAGAERRRRGRGVPQPPAAFGGAGRSRRAAHPHGPAAGARRGGSGHVRRRPDAGPASGRRDVRPVQGERFAHAVVNDLIEELLAGGAAGAGQSSWGPAVYGLVRGAEAAQRLARRAEERLAGRGVVLATAFDNTGARCWAGDGP